VLYFTENVKIKLYLLIKYYTIKAYGRVEIQLHAVFTFAPDGSDCQLHALAIVPQGKVPATHSVRG
jgi:hypothetical protein